MSPTRIVATEYGRGYAAGYAKALSDARAALESALSTKGPLGDEVCLRAALDALDGKR